MAEPPGREALADDLVIQEVILDSLQAESFDGVERERAEARREIVRLKALLAQQPLSPHDDGDAGRDGRHHAPLPHTSLVDSAAGSSDSALSHHSPAPSTTPTARRSAIMEPPSPHHRTAAFSTPRKSAKRNDTWASPNNGGFPSLKRERESPLQGVAQVAPKARRITPTPRRRGFLASSQEEGEEGADVDVIDLTGDDVDYDAACIARHIREENRHEQEMRDRQLAIQLSSQEPPSSEAPPAAAPESGHTNAFSKIMASQMPSSHGPLVRSQGSPSHPPPAPVMPGAFNTRWDAPHGSNPYLLPTPPRTALVDQPHGPFRKANHPLPLISTGLEPGFSTAVQAQSFGVDGIPPSYGSLFARHQPAGLPTGRFQSGPGIDGTYGAPALPSSDGLSLLDAIGKTNLIDYGNRVDADGNPLDERLTSFLDHAYHDPNVTEKELDELLQNIRPDMDTSEACRDGTPAGLKQPLYPHQELALSWMKKMEEGTNKGGILADDMGLGKTISTLALMLSRPGVGRVKTTLIIGPLSLVRQWEEEIMKKTKLSHRLSVFVYHSTKATTDDLLRYDVVLTTYGTIAQELKRLENFLVENGNRNIDFNDRANALKFPLLHPRKAIFHRVVLDEAQCIKNKKTRTAKACYELKATYRWCLTGTPMMNGVIELFSLVHFLRIKPYCMWESFRQAFGTLCGLRGEAKGVAMSRLRALLKAIMLRRKKDSQVDGKPILKLPPKTESVVYAKLSPDEMAFYKQLEEKSQVLFSKYLRENTIGKNYSFILVLLLRMRQACCHPHLNLDVDEVGNVGQETLNESMLKLIKGLDKATVERIKSLEMFECPICFDAIQSPAFFIPCGHDSCKDCVARLADNAAAANLQSGDESDKAKCPVCRGAFDPKKCFSYEAFRTVHMPETVIKKSDPDVETFDSNTGSDSGMESESETDVEVDAKGNLRGFVVDDDSDRVDRVETNAKGNTKSRKKIKKGNKRSGDVKASMLKSLRLEAAKNRSAYKRYMRYLRKTWMPAAKVTECMKLIQKIQETGATEKTIIFSQWTLLLDLLEVAMWKAKFKEKPVRYDGSMSGEDRARVAQEFRDRANVRVMLVSLRAGNAGLNLTSANNVIIMEPFWNPYIEMQAVDRAHRIGQQREVKVYRILTEETVEDRIIALQERKKAIVEAALDETESMKIGRLNVSELKFLFNTRD